MATLQSVKAGDKLIPVKFLSEEEAKKGVSIGAKSINTIFDYYQNGIFANGNGKRRLVEILEEVHNSNGTIMPARNRRFAKDVVAKLLAIQLELNDVLDNAGDEDEALDLTKKE